MAEAVVLQFSGVGLDEYWAVNKELGIDMIAGTGEFPPGLISHAGGTTDDGALGVIEVWETRDDLGAFLETRLGPALAAAGVTTEPTITWVSLATHRHLG